MTPRRSGAAGSPFPFRNNFGRNRSVGPAAHVLLHEAADNCVPRSAHAPCDWRGGSRQFAPLVPGGQTATGQDETSHQHASVRREARLPPLLSPAEQPEGASPCSLQRALTRS
jgi:hypothetical protein